MEPGHEGRGFPGGSDLQCRRPSFNPWVEKIPWRRKWQLTPVFLPGEFHGQRSLMKEVEISGPKLRRGD